MLCIKARLKQAVSIKIVLLICNFVPIEKKVINEI